MRMFSLQVIQLVPSNFSLTGNIGGAPPVEDIVSSQYVVCVFVLICDFRALGP